MRVLVVGSGGREHALAWAISASPLVDAPLLRAGQCRDRRRSRVRARSARPTSPGSSGSAVASGSISSSSVPKRRSSSGSSTRSKPRASRPSDRAPPPPHSKPRRPSPRTSACAPQIPTAAYRRFRDPAAAKAFIASHGAPIVVKADGLAAGKGVTVAERSRRGLSGGRRRPRRAPLRRGRARDRRRGLSRRRGGELLCAGRRQERAAARLGPGLQARSATATPGRTPAAWAPVRRRPCLTPALEGMVMERIILPAVAAMEREGRPFKGVLYAGLMLTEAGPMLLEFNVRLGDPEAQVLMMRLMSDLLPALIAARDGVLKSVDLRWHAEHALCVVMAAKGYPGRARARQRDPRSRRRGGRPEGQDLPRRHPPRRKPAARRWRPGARRHGTRRRSQRRPRPRLRRGRPHRVARGLLPPRHRRCALIFPPGAAIS